MAYTIYTGNIQLLDGIGSTRIDVVATGKYVSQLRLSDKDNLFPRGVILQVLDGEHYPSGLYPFSSGLVMAMLREFDPVTAWTPTTFKTNTSTTLTVIAFKPTKGKGSDIFGLSFCVTMYA